jgi:hypothetical protein
VTPDGTVYLTALPGGLPRRENVPESRTMRRRRNDGSDLTSTINRSWEELRRSQARSRELAVPQKCGWMSVLSEDCAMQTCAAVAVVTFTLGKREEHRCAGHAECFREEHRGSNIYEESRAVVKDQS